MSKLASLTQSAAAIAVAALTLGTTPAAALPMIDRELLDRHCIAKYMPLAIHANADTGLFIVPTVGNLNCRVNTNGIVKIVPQLPTEVCLSRTGATNWVNNGGRVECMPPTPTTPTVTTPNLPDIQPPPCRGQLRNGVFVCL